MFAPCTLVSSPGQPAGWRSGSTPASESGSPVELASPASTATAALSPARMVTEASCVVIWSALASAGTAETATVPVALPRPSLTV